MIHQIIQILHSMFSRGKITSRGCPEDVPKRLPMDVPIWPSM